MKSLSKADIAHRFKQSNFQSVTEIIELKKPIQINNVTMNKMVRIVIPGEPIVDSRPRFMQSRDGSIRAYNPHKAQLMKVFKEIYDPSDVLHGLVILGPIYAEIDLYKPVPKTYMRFMTNKDKMDLLNERFIGCSTPDVDNIEKINYDVLQDDAYAIILRDEMIIRNQTTKYFVMDPKNSRVEVRLYYNDTLPKWCKEITQNTSEYLKFTLSMKYKFINQISDEDWCKRFFQNIVVFYKRTKKKPITTVRAALRSYSKKDLDLIHKEKNTERAIEAIITIVESLLIQIK